AAIEANPSGRSPPITLVPSMTGTPSRPRTEPSASATTRNGTASSATSVPDTSPPSCPTSTTSWPASRHRVASPPPTLPRPITAIFISIPLVRLEQRTPSSSPFFRDQRNVNLAAGLAGDPERPALAGAAGHDHVERRLLRRLPAELAPGW